MKENMCLKSDSYKFGHWKQLIKGTDKVYSYYESRLGARFNRTVMFSLQAYLMEYFVGTVITQDDVDKAKVFIDAHLKPNVFNVDGWQYILDEYDGKLPISIKAVPEGTIVPVGNVLFTVESVDPKTSWLTNFFESLLLKVWYGCAAATYSLEMKLMLMEFLEKNSDNPVDVINFMFHNFGYRSASSEFAAACSGGAQLLSFMGTDTTTGIEFLMNFYDSNVCGFSVTATEHSVASSEGREGEFNVVQRLLDDNPDGILSLVIDTYDYRNFIKVLGTRFKNQILARDGKLVFRPDSGMPVPTVMECLNLIGKYFGTYNNKKEFICLNPKTGLLWGDGNDFNMIYKILTEMDKQKWAADNIVFGQGGAYVHSELSRDMQRTAFKSSYQEVNGLGKSVYKDPIDVSKRSKKGRLALVQDNEGNFQTIEEVKGDIENDMLVEVFRTGELLVKYSIDDIKENMNKYL